MKRAWLTVPDSMDDEEVTVVNVVPGVQIDGHPTHHGHMLGPECDCHPETIERLDRVVLVHRHDV